MIGNTQRHEAERPSLRHCERILLVEDEASVRAMTKRILVNNGYEVVEACNGLDALRKIEAADHPFDLVLTDIVMPDLSGIELGQHLGRLLPGLKVLYMSGSQMAATDELPPGTTLVNKPFNQDQLLTGIRAVIEGDASGQVTFETSARSA
jgi:CheY-like chemotaxis protein